MTPAWLVPLVGFTLFSIVFAGLTWFRPRIGRVVGGLLLLGGGLFNTYLGITNPIVYADFRQWAVLDLYRAVIDAVFPAYGTPFILAIAFGQLLSASLLLLGGRWITLGAIGGLIFSLGIVPLGIGSAFPAPLFMALAYALLLVRTIRKPPTLKQNWPTASEASRTRELAGRR